MLQGVLRGSGAAARAAARAATKADKSKRRVSFDPQVYERLISPLPHRKDRASMPATLLYGECDPSISSAFGE